MNSRPAILFVDHNERNVELLTAFLRESGYSATGLTEIRQLDELLDSEEERSQFALAFVDLMGFDGSIWERCRRMYDAGISFVVIARAQSSAAQQQLERHSQGMGARHTLTKPLRKDQLLTLVRILTGTDD